MSEVADFYRLMAAQNRARWLKENYGDLALDRAKKDLAEAERRGLKGLDLIIHDWTIAALEGRL